MTQAQAGNTVKVHYTGKLQDGAVFDSSEGRDPLEFELGAGRVIPGFEQAVVGMSPGEKKTATVEAKDAYGPHRDEMVVAFERKQLPENLEPQVGQQLELKSQEGQPIPAVVTNVDEEQVTLDANHPLAGKDLTFDLELVDVAEGEES